MSKLVCFGLGYCAETLARRLQQKGWAIVGTSRSQQGVDRIQKLGYEGLLFDGRTPAPGIPAALSGATHVLLSAAPEDTGDPVLVHHGQDLAAATSVRWIGYLSTIGVYGDSGGEWIDEGATPHPGSERTRRRVAAEHDWLQFGQAHGKTVQIFRLGGIYGPGRSAIEDLRDGTARRIVKPGQVFNRIHVDDIASVLEAAAAGAGSHKVYNVTDGEPSPPQDVISYAAELLGLAPPPELPFDTADLSPMARSFYSENRRVSSALLRSDLGVTLRYPSYREGLAAILAASES